MPARRARSQGGVHTPRDDGAARAGTVRGGRRYGAGTVRTVTQVVGVVAGLLLGPGCRASNFACVQSADCGAGGRCEPNSWCSFPDGACESGRRYGEYSGEGLGGVCLPSTDTDTDATTTLGTGVTSGPPLATGSSSDSGSSTSEPVVEETGCAAGACGTTGDRGRSTVGGSDTSRSEDASTTDDELCSVSFADDFDDDIVDPSWDSFTSDGSPHVMTEFQGELRWEFQSGVAAFTGLSRPVGGFGSVRLELGELPVSVNGHAQLVFSLRGLPEPLFLVWTDGLGRFRYGGGTVAEWEPALWTELRAVDDGLRLSISDDGQTWTSVEDLPLALGLPELSVALYGQTWTAGDPASGSMRAIELCEN